MNELAEAGDENQPGPGGRGSWIRTRLVPLVVITAAITVLILVGREIRGGSGPDRVRKEIGPEYYDAVRRLNLVELAEYDVQQPFHRTIPYPQWWIVKDSELEIDACYSVGVTIGIDLEHAMAEYIGISGNRVEVTLPEPGVINTSVREIDFRPNSSGMPRDWTAEVLAARADFIEDAGEEAIEDVLASGAVEHAEEVAVVQITTALMELGVEEVDVRFD